MVPVQAALKWNYTTETIEKGRIYNLSAQGWWVDWFIPCGPDGYANLLAGSLNHKKRCPLAHWFKLIGSIDADESYLFEIGIALLDYQAPRSGRLTCFANDMEAMYWNNWGAIELTVELVR
jgi:hypothetical protein